MSRALPVSLILLGAVGVVVCIALLCGYAWAIGVAGALALIAGVLLYDPTPSPKERARMQAGRAGGPL